MLVASVVNKKEMSPVDGVLARRSAVSWRVRAIDTGDTTGGEEGSMTIWFAGFSAALVVVALLISSVTAVWSAKTHVQAVADMAALAGADISSVAVFEAAPTRSLPCAQAEEVAKRNGAVLSECWVTDADTRVVVQKPVSLFVFTTAVSARARAGPSPNW